MKLGPSLPPEGQEQKSNVYIGGLKEAHCPKVPPAVAHTKSHTKDT